MAVKDVLSMKQLNELHRQKQELARQRMDCEKKLLIICAEEKILTEKCQLALEGRKGVLSFHEVVWQ